MSQPANSQQNGRPRDVNTYLLCEDTGELACNGECPEHGGDACLIVAQWIGRDNEAVAGAILAGVEVAAKVRDANQAERRRLEVEVAALETMIERAIAAVEWEPGDAQRALRELRDSYDAPGQKRTLGGDGG